MRSGLSSCGYIYKLWDELIKNEKNICNLLIGADGPNSIVRRTFSFQEPKEHLIGLGAEVENTKLDPNFVEIFILIKVIMIRCYIQISF